MEQFPSERLKEAMIGMSSYRIFVAEDDSIILMGLKMTLEHLGHTIAGEASDGETAVERIFETKPQLLLLDINMPKKDGLEILEEVHRRASVPAIILTAYPDDALVAKAKGLGAYGYLIKPVLEEQLKTAIEMAMGRHQDLRNAKRAAQQAERALSDRKKIERAKGILMDSFGLKEADAQKALQKKSRDQNKKLAEVAEEIIASSKALL